MNKIKLEGDITVFGAYSQWKSLKLSMEQAINLTQENVLKEVCSKTAENLF